jgi:fructosamine-3-kinase
MNVQAQAFRAEIEDAADGIITDIRPFAQGHGARLFLIDLKDGRRLVAKIALRAQGAALDREGWMLTYLRHNTELPVPRVISATPEKLLMSYVPEGGGIDGDVARDAADHLAALHNVLGLHYGFERTTPIGSLPQDNTPGTDWIAFFRERRLLAMAHAAREEGRLDPALHRRIEKLAGRLERRLGESGPPSLIHGDVWAGNILALNGRIAAFIDPAIYFADAEIELAFISLFHTFDDTFYARYAEHHPIRPGFWEERRHIYNLYPLLVHLRLYGGAYVPALTGILDRFAA